MRKREEKLVITFHTTAEAIAMESACKRDGIKGRMIPVPRSISSGCGLAFCCELSFKKDVEEYLNNLSLDTEGVYHCFI